MSKIILRPINHDSIHVGMKIKSQYGRTLRDVVRIAGNDVLVACSNGEMYILGKDDIVRYWYEVVL